MGESIKVKLHEGGYMPERHGAFCDLATKREERLKRGEVRIIPLGVSMKLPDGYWGFLVPRSSTCLKHGIMEANSVGVVEPDYCGDGDEWGFVAYAIRDTVIPAGTRICQFAAMPLMPEVELEQVDTTGHPDRGGYGSTGEKVAPKLLDADGVEIKVGDELYVIDINGDPVGAPCKVTAIGRAGFDVERQDGMPGHATLSESYTHRKPDSWEKLRLDIERADDACDYFGYGSCGDCPVREKPGTCNMLMAQDVLKRAKRLAGVADE